MELGVTLLFYFEFVYYSNIEISLKWLGKLFKSNLLYNNSIKPLFYSVLTFNTNAKVLNNFPENCVCVKLKMEVKFQTVVMNCDSAPFNNHYLYLGASDLGKNF